MRALIMRWLDGHHSLTFQERVPTLFHRLIATMRSVDQIVKRRFLEDVMDFEIHVTRESLLVMNSEIVMRLLPFQTVGSP